MSNLLTYKHLNNNKKIYLKNLIYNIIILQKYITIQILNL